MSNKLREDLTLPSVLNAKIHHLTKAKRKADTINDAAFAAQQSSVRDRQAAVAEEGYDEQRHNALGLTMDPARRQQHADAIALATEESESAATTSREANADLGLKTEVLASCVAYLNDGSFTLRDNVDEPPLPKGMSSLEAISQERDRQQDLRADARNVEKAAPPQEDVLQAFGKRLDEQSRPADYNLTFAGGELAISFPVAAVLAEASGGLPVAPDFRPNFIRARRAEILEEAERVLAEHYEWNVSLVMTTEEKRSRLADLAVAKLESERRECFFVWQAIEAGEGIFFRSDTDPRAILDVDGPSPVRRRRF